MPMQFDVWIRFYLDAECHFSYTAMDFFEEYSHTINTYQLRQPGSDCQYCSKIYCDYLARVEKSQGCLSSLMYGKINYDHFQRFLTEDFTERHLFALAFAYWWNMAENQKRILAETTNENDWRKSWDILNYFLCNSEKEALPPLKELKAFRYHGTYLCWRVNDIPENGTWIEVEHPEEVFL